MPKSTKLSVRAIANLVAAYYVKVSYGKGKVTKIKSFLRNVDFRVQSHLTQNQHYIF